MHQLTTTAEDLVATLIARTGVAAFATAFQQGADADSAADFRSTPDHVFDRLRAAISPAPPPAAGPNQRRR